MRQHQTPAPSSLATTRQQTAILGLFRIVVGLLFASHGASTLFGVLGGPPGPSPDFAAWPGWWAAAIQLIGGLLVLLGLGTRTSAVICSGSMAYAYFTEHQASALFPIQNGGEPAAMFCWTFLLIAALGPGDWALGTLLRRTETPVRGSRQIT
ncbi:DoxX family protein [Streptomyces oceani]|uniref:DoxX family protein n=1 Tax=Streptomyces oceani TaxID=1075402 RepID=A0A1E7KJ20_9ACTN|nr:DoxX family protein [Streptomyces oceani]OEV03844.1 DoxX family protein [Streptomyces oceani]